MAFFNKEPNQLLIDLINEANPDVGIDLRTLQNTKLGNPAVYPNIRNQQTLRVVKAFTQTGAHRWTPPRGVTKVDVLVVAGGGAGGYDERRMYNTPGGGGGAGGLVFIPDYHITDRPIEIIVGAGGNGNYSTIAADGDDSRFGKDIVAVGGGRGGGIPNAHDVYGKPGGSSGGHGQVVNDTQRSRPGGRAIQPHKFGVSGDYGFGNTGTRDPSSLTNQAYGGGGAGTPGTQKIYSVDNQTGGDGLCKVTPDTGPYIQEYRFSEVFGFDHGDLHGDDVWFCGGGGSGCPRSADRSYGGKGGGANSTTENGSWAGKAGTGGGGSGKGRSKYSTGGNGGSGIVIIAYNNPRVNQPALKYQDINTEIDIYPTPELPFKGKVTLYYRRINLTNFFKNRVVKFTRWTDNNRLTTAQLLELYNEEFGTQLVTTDFPDTSFTSSNSVQVLNVLPTSYTYIGRLEFVWTQGERELSQILETDNIDGYVWDAKHEVLDNEKPYLTLLGWGFDYSQYNDMQYTSVPNGAVIDRHTPMLNGLVDTYNAINHTELSTDTPHTEVNGLGGLTVMRWSLPNNAADEANSLKYNQVLVIRAESDSWFTGCVLFHYNPK